MPAAPGPRSPWARSVIVAAAVLALAGGVIVLARRTPAPPALGKRAAITLDPGLEINPAISPDGKLVAYSRITPGRESAGGPTTLGWRAGHRSPAGRGSRRHSRPGRPTAPGCSTARRAASRWCPRWVACRASSRRRHRISGWAGAPAHGRPRATGSPTPARIRSTCATWTRKHRRASWFGVRRHTRRAGHPMADTSRSCRATSSTPPRATLRPAPSGW